MKGSIVGQVFIFIIAGLVFVLILSYGYKSIQSLILKSEEVAVVDFQADFRGAVENVKRNYGSVREFDVKLPSHIDGVCIVELGDCPDSVSFTRGVSDFDLDWVADACELRSSNVFLVPRSVDFFVPDVVVDDPGYVCVSREGSLGLEGMGRSARVFVWK